MKTLPVLVGAVGLTLAALVPLKAPARHSLNSWNPTFVEAATFGSATVAAEFMWMRAVQLIGDRNFETEGKPHLADWLENVSRLDPTLRAPYQLGAVALIGREADAARIDAMLAVGEEQFPDDWSFPQLRGFIAYFGGQENKRAADHYERASQLPGAPSFLPAFVRRLREQDANCKELRAQLEDVQRQDEPEAFHANANEVVINCVRNEIKRAAARFRNNGMQGELTTERLVELGLLAEAPPTRPGFCWLPSAGSWNLEPCPGKQP